MAKKYEVDGKYFLPVTVFTTDARSINPIGVQYVFAGNGSKGTTYLDDYPDLLLTAEEIYASRQTADKIEYLTDMLDYGRKKYDEIEELKSRNAELEALLKEVMETRDEAIRQNDELRKENENLKSDCNDWKDTADDRIVDVQNLTAERDNLKADLTTQKEVNEELKTKIAELTAWYEEANKTASEAAEANDELKKKIVELRKRVGEQSAQIQDLNAEVHFHKEFGEGLDKQQKELQARYDELDSVNKEQAEKIRKLDAHNVYLKGLLSAKKKMRIVLNNGSMYDVEVGDKVHPVYDMNNNLFFVKTEGGTVTSFIIGKEPGNIAGWYLV